MTTYIGERRWDSFPSSSIVECIEYLKNLDYISLDTETQGLTKN